VADKDKPSITAPSESREIPINREANHPTEKPVLFRASGDDVDRSGLGQAANYRPSAQPSSALEQAAAVAKETTERLKEGSQRPVRQAIQRARRTSDERDSVRDNSNAQSVQTPPPDKGASAESNWTYVDGAVLGLSELLFLLFGLPFGDDLYHDKPITPAHWFYLSVAVLCAIGGPMWPLIRKRWASQRISASVSNAALDARTWIAVLIGGFLYVAAPGMYHRATAPVASAPPFSSSSVLCSDGPCAPVHLKPAPQYLKEIGLGTGSEPLSLGATSVVTAERLRVFVDYSEYRSGWMPKARAFIGELKEPVKGKTERLQLIYSAVKANGGTNNLWWGDPSQNHDVSASTFNGSPLPAIIVRGRVAIIGSSGEQHYYFILVRGAENIGTQVGVIPEYESGDWIESWEKD